MSKTICVDTHTETCELKMVKVKEFFILLCTVVFTRCFDFKDFDLKDYNYDESTNISYGEVFLGRSGGLLNRDHPPSRSDHPEYSLPSTTISSTTTTRTTTTTNHPSTSRSPARSLSTTPIATSTSSAPTPNEDEAGSGGITWTVEATDHATEAFGKINQVQHKQDDIPNTTPKANRSIPEYVGAEDRERGNLENSLVIRILSTFEALQRHLQTSRPERDHPNPYGPVNIFCFV